MLLFAKEGSKSREARTDDYVFKALLTYFITAPRDFKFLVLVLHRQLVRDSGCTCLSAPYLQLPKVQDDVRTRVGNLHRIMCSASHITHTLVPEDQHKEEVEGDC
jgi:hypothetical protein